MDTKKKSGGVFRFVVLIPHRDTVKLLEEYREKLFSLGMTGACSFAPAAALARVSRFLSRKELGELARTLRETSGGNDGKFRTKGTAIAAYGNLSIFGLALELPPRDALFPETAKEKISGETPPPVLSSALIGPEALSAGANRLPESAVADAPLLSFRAAAVANMALRPLPEGAENSFEWKLGAPVWLPAYKRKRTIQ